MNGVPAARAPLSAAWSPTRSSSSRSSAGSRNVMASGEPGQGGRVRVFGEVHGDAGGDDPRRLPGINAAGGQLVPPGPARLEVDRHQSQPRGDTEALLDETSALPRLGAGLVDLEHPEVGGDLGLALGEGIQTGAQDDVLANALAGLLGNQILDETSTNDNGRPEPAGAGWVHVRAPPPTVPRCCQLQADLVLAHMGRRGDLDVP